ncbi:hypothetical protein Anapl_17371 [Anas platyrhynchos]|uniref:Uncharacterized protein n=1 Tax=Anas platyrhynchos TaxID=8839 RepID=R0JXS6_ANAPL|nr:hypothetical protein Anapl_17371 [Anas platyrhynchos]
MVCREKGAQKMPKDKQRTFKYKIFAPFDPKRGSVTLANDMRNIQIRRPSDTASILTALTFNSFCTLTHTLHYPSENRKHFADKSCFSHTVKVYIRKPYKTNTLPIQNIGYLAEMSPVGIHSGSYFSANDDDYDE